jgi:hypothetical protein
MQGVCMSNLIVLPDGNAVSQAQIKSVTYAKGRIVCRDAFGNNVVWLEIKDTKQGEKVRDELIRVAQEGPQAMHPDWSFMVKA